MLCIIRLTIIALWVFKCRNFCLYNELVTSHQVKALDISPDRAYVAAGLNNDDVQVYDFDTKGLLYTNTNCSHDIGAVRFSPHQTYLAIGCRGGNNNYIVSGTAPFGYIRSLSTAGRQTYCMDFNSDESLLLIGSNDDDQVEVFYTANWSSAFIGPFSGSVRACRFAPNDQFAAGSNDGEVHTYYANFTLRWGNDYGSFGMRSLGWSTDSNTLIVGDNSNELHIWSPVTSSSKTTITIGNSDNQALGFSPDGRYYASGNEDDNAYVFDLIAGSFTNNTQVLDDAGQELNALDFSDDSQFLLTGSKDDSVYFYKTKCGFDIPACTLEHYRSSGVCRLCALDMIGCRRCETSTVCLNCTDGYFLNSGTDQCSSCSVVHPFCSQCDSASGCTVCLPGRYLASATSCLQCWAAIEGCLICADSSTCTKCIGDSYFLDTANHTCVSCFNLTYCHICNSSTYCLACLPGTYNLNGSCLNCSWPCEVCDSASTCTICPSGMYVNSTNGCSSCPSDCLTCNDTACFSCSFGFYLSSLACLPCEPPCAICSSSTVCESCTSGFFLSSPGSCSSCAQNCLSCSSSSDCSLCSPGFYLVNNATCNSCQLFDNSCLLCDGYSCTVCSSGHYLKSGQCDLCLDSLNGCLLCHITTVCLLCDTHYYQLNDTCFRCIEPCLTCSSASTCESCINGYYESGGSCSLCPCPSCLSASQCLSCQQGLFIDNGVCLACNQTAGCLTCLSASVCQSCLPGYYLHSNSSCVPCASSDCAHCNGMSCLSCGSGFYLDTGSCFSCPLGCASCNTSSQCFSCNLTYYLASNMTCHSCSSLFPDCEVCTQSKCLLCNYQVGKVLNGSSQCQLCIDLIPFCINCLNSSICMVCAGSTILVGGACSNCSFLIANCQICYNSTHCDACFTNYYLSGDNCERCPSGCSACNSSTNCLICQDGFTLLPNGTCQSCAENITGCAQCSSSACVKCIQGMHLSGGACESCQIVLQGCLSCLNSTHCFSCSDFYYLNSSVNQCSLCSNASSNCLICNQSDPTQCLECQRGYSLVFGLCQPCSFSGCASCSQDNVSICLLCQTGYYLSSDSCLLCQSLFEGCVTCNSGQCLDCASGYYLTSGNCANCSLVGCQRCSSTHSSECLSCNSGFYRDESNQCVACSSVIADCQMCESASNCTNCQYGMVYNGLACVDCSSMFSGCLSCSNSACVTCASDYFRTSASSCIGCSTVIQGCIKCTDNSTCTHCKPGYYLNTGICLSCSTVQGCQICTDSTNCLRCSISFYLDTGSCINCSISVPDCIACLNSSDCLACREQYTLENNTCIPVPSALSYQLSSSLRLVTVYLSNSELKHTLIYLDGNFSDSSFILTSHISLVCLEGSNTIPLKISSYEWGNRHQSIIFYSDNPIDFNSYYSSIQLFDRRLLASNNLNIQVDFQLTMDSTATSQLMEANQGPYVCYSNSNQQQFQASIRKTRSYSYHFISLILTLSFLTVFMIQLCCFTGAKDKGAIMAHVLLLKMPVLMLNDAYAQLHDFCEGFMYADLPWFIDKISEMVGDYSQDMPSPYRYYYVSLNIVSTYALPLMVITLLAIVCFLGTIYFQSTMKATWELIYNFFITGLVVSSWNCLINTTDNSVSDISTNSLFYLLGILIFLMVVSEAIKACVTDLFYLYKLRIIVKACILAICHFSPLYIFPLVLVSEAAFMWCQLQLTSDILSPKLWFFSNVLCDLSLLLLVWFSQSLLVIYLASGFIAIALVLQVIRIYSLTKHTKQVNFEGNNHTLGCIKTSYFSHESCDQKQQIDDEVAEAPAIYDSWYLSTDNNQITQSSFAITHRKRRYQQHRTHSMQSSD